MPRKIVRRLRRRCSLGDCLRPIRVILYEDGSYRGGHFFGRIIEGKGIKGEYWECPPCYWGKEKG